jgi:hypothetical protein
MVDDVVVRVDLEVVEVLVAGGGLAAEEAADGAVEGPEGEADDGGVLDGGALELVEL